MTNSTARTIWILSCQIIIGPQHKNNTKIRLQGNMLQTTIVRSGGAVGGATADVTVREPENTRQLPLSLSGKYQTAVYGIC